MKQYITFILFLLSIVGHHDILAQNTFFVAPNGRDKNKGSIKAPFLNIEKAQLSARAVKGETIIYLRAGEYHLTQPLVFTEEDGNTNKHLTLKSYPGEHAVISGSILIQPQWKPYKDRIMQAKINLSFPPEVLTCNCEIRHMARYPNYDSLAVRFNGTSADATSRERVKSWKNPKGGYLHVMHASDWGDFHYRITGKDDEGNLQMEGGHQNNRKSGLSQNNRMVENIFEELDAPGEWYYDISTSVLYYYPEKDEDINSSQYEVAFLKHLIELRGSEKKPVKNITIEDLELTQTTRTFMEKYEPLLRSDWTIYRGGAIFFERSEDCKLTDCYLHNLGGNAIFVSNYNRNIKISGSHITHIGATAICFVGNPQAVRSPCFEYNESIPIDQIDKLRGPKSNDYPSHCYVYNNLIHDIGLFEKQISGVELSMCQYITISHNSIYDTPRAGINVSEGTWGGHIIEYNDIFNTVKETGDHGSFNSWGRDRFWHPNRSTMNDITRNYPSLILADAVATTTIRNNRFRCDRGWDIDLDDGSSNYHIYNNLCLNGGIKLREGFYRIVENNILVNNTFHPHVWFRQNGDVFTRNIVMTPYLPINISEWGAETDYNIFTDSLIYKASRKNNTDIHSIVCQVHFTDYQKGDYSIQDTDNEVFRMGFCNFDMNSFGVISPQLKQLARQPKYSFPIIHQTTDEADIKVWQGLRIKKLQTLDERSATGMDSERGIYVIDVVDYYSPLNNYLKSNDVILKLGDASINTIDELFSTLEKIDLKVPQNMVVFRNQKECIVSIPVGILKGALK